jgi:Beta-lactamase
MTVRQMLTHTSGMLDVKDYQWDKPEYDDGALERYVRGLRDQGLRWQPGSKYAYSTVDSVQVSRCESHSQRRIGLLVPGVQEDFRPRRTRWRDQRTLLGGVRLNRLRARDFPTDGYT